MVELAVTGISAHSVRPLRYAVWLALAFAALGGLLRSAGGGERTSQAATMQCR